MRRPTAPNNFPLDEVVVKTTTESDQQSAKEEGAARVLGRAAASPLESHAAATSLQHALVSRSPDRTSDAASDPAGQDQSHRAILENSASPLLRVPGALSLHWLTLSLVV